jgi:hypothetical protein
LIKVVFVSEPFDKFNGRFVRLPVISQIFFVDASIGYRYAVNLMKAIIDGIAPIAIRLVYRGNFHRVFRLEPPYANPVYRSSK